MRDEDLEVKETAGTGEVTLSQMRADGGKTIWKCERRSLASVLHGIKAGTWKKAIEGLRAISDAEARRRAKPFRQPRLDVFGVYADGAREEDIVARSDYFVCDYDGKDNPGADWEAIKDVMAACPWTAAVFRSASGNGLKWVVRYNEPELDKDGSVKARADADVQFWKLNRFITGIFPTLKADTGTQARRHTFVSYDAEAYVAPDLAALTKIQDLEEPGEKGRKCRLPIERLIRIFKPIVETVWSTGKDYAEILGAGRDIPVRNESQAFAIFSTKGFPKSRKEELLLHIRQTRHLSAIYEGRVGYRAGVFRNPETRERFAVKYGPKWIDGDEGSFPTIQALLDARVNDPECPQQGLIFLKLLQNCRTRIREMLDAHDAGERVYNQTRAPMACFMGVPAVGKSKLFEMVIRPILGGRDFDAKKFFTSDDRFTGGLEFNEIMLIDDLSSKAVMKFNRTAMTERGKALYSSVIAAESKFRDETTLKDSCHVAFQLFNPETIESTPIYDSSPDKFVFFNIGRYAELPCKTAKDWDAFNRAIERELDAFAFYVDCFELPESMTEGLSAAEQRNEMPYFCHPACKELLTESDPGMLLLEELDNYAEKRAEEQFYAKGFPSDPIHKAADLAAKISSQMSAKSIGRTLRQLSERAETKARVRAWYGTGSQSSGKIRGWKIFKSVEK